MPIKIKVSDGLMCPVFFCDICGGEIREYQKGVYIYDGLSTKSNHPGELSFVHRGDCHNAIDEKFKSKGLHPSWNALGNFLIFLVNNAGVKSFVELKKNVESWNIL